MGLPDRWMDYRPMGTVIPGTRFIAFKVPLKEDLCRNLPKGQRFTPQHIMDENPNISLIVDLTNTTRYYDKTVFQNANKSYVKIFCPGHIVPAKKIVSQFFESVDKFLSEHPDDDTLIGVHCTHGVNRTGYFICKYMIDKMGVDPSRAIEDVGRARGYPIERKNYLEDLGDESLPAERDRVPNIKPGYWRDSVRPNNDERERSFVERSSYNDRGCSNLQGNRSDIRRGREYSGNSSEDKGVKNVPSLAGRDRRTNIERGNWRSSMRPKDNERGRSSNERNSYNSPDRSKWQRDKSTNRIGRVGNSGTLRNCPRYDRQGGDFQRSSVYGLRNYDSGRSQNWNERRPSRNYQSNREGVTRPTYTDQDQDHRSDHA